MIKPEDKEIIIAVIGTQYSPELANHLKKKKIRNAKGKFFSQESVRRFVCGYDENDAVEDAIIDYVVAKKVSKNEAQEKRSEKLRA
ncbi:MAG TPA: hypothetical protein VK528_11215 [Flavobacterium sp.]|nr:hypothetical protein [Flavobacterium sp.]